LHAVGAHDPRTGLLDRALDEHADGNVARESVPLGDDERSRAVRSERGDRGDEAAPIFELAPAADAEIVVPRDDTRARLPGPRFDRRALRFGSDLLLVGGHTHVGDDDVRISGLRFAHASTFALVPSPSHSHWDPNVIDRGHSRHAG